MAVFCSTTACKAADADQWYTEVDNRLGKTTFGASTGRGKQKDDASFGIAKIDAKLHMFYVHHDLTPQLHIMGEYTLYKGDLNGATDTKYSFVSLGMQYNF